MKKIVLSLPLVIALGSFANGSAQSTTPQADSSHDGVVLKDIGSSFEKLLAHMYYSIAETAGLVSVRVRQHEVDRSMENSKSVFKLTMNEISKGVKRAENAYDTARKLEERVQKLEAAVKTHEAMFRAQADQKKQ